MKNMGTMLRTREAFSELVIGNTAIVRAMLESGVRVVSSYPGSPTPEIADAIRALPPASRPFHFEFSTNEKVAVELAFGAAINGRLSAVFFKSVGLNVAADSFVQLPLMDIPGGLVIVLGDDPGVNSSQNEQDNRHLARMAYCPLFEPASAQEAYDMFKKAASLARDMHMAVILRLTTHVCHAKEKVRFGPYTPVVPDDTPRFDAEASEYIPIGAAVFPLKKRALGRLALIESMLGGLGFDRLVDHGNPARGIICAGLPFASVLDALDQSNPGAVLPDVLKLGAVYPFDHSLVEGFLASHEEVKLIEELDPLLEADIKALAYDAGLRTRIIGKADAREYCGELTPSRAMEILRACWPDLLQPEVQRPEAFLPMAPRPAQLCPGCGHRSAFHAIRKGLAEDDITVADIGCHTLGHLPPYKMGQVLLSMGHSTSTASGLTIFNDSRRVVCFLGDSTFFHAGLPGIVNAVYNAHRVLLIVLENGTTAMTGHQDHPGTGRNFNGATTKLSVRSVLEGLGVANIREVDAYKQTDLTAMVRDALDEQGFKVIIARHPCMLKFTREARRKAGWSARRVKIDQGVCEQAHDCVERFACPTFQRDAV
ncbi:MAG: indolepyruvate ferredoxin oxidoreductase, partial [Spirochaetes bacterium RIFOXYC1_FULL_54_7]